MGPQNLNHFLADIFPLSQVVPGPFFIDENEDDPIPFPDADAGRVQGQNRRLHFFPSAEPHANHAPTLVGLSLGDEIHPAPGKTILFVLEQASFSRLYIVQF